MLRTAAQEGGPVASEADRLVREIGAASHRGAGPTRSCRLAVRCGGSRTACALSSGVQPARTHGVDGGLTPR
ncbi:hypothetical protein ABT330_34625 [Streptomyces sp. NPDC000658]|uniref:hypothetical protein n=1 Tax=Streptomyces sp. NPDC000658 TaxID=3154266 RepID=UPI00331DCE90